MKRTLCFMMIAVTLFGLVACGTTESTPQTTQGTTPTATTGAVVEDTTPSAEDVVEETMPPAEGLAPHPMQRKEYIPASGANATPDELRAIAVQIMEDELHDFVQLGRNDADSALYIKTKNKFIH